MIYHVNLILVSLNMAYFEITGLQTGSKGEDFGPTVSLELEKGRGLSILSDNESLPKLLSDAVEGKSRFSGEIILNGMRIDPIPSKKRAVHVLGGSPGIVPGRTVRQNLEAALASSKRSLSIGEEVFLVDQELETGSLAGTADLKAGNLDDVGRTVLAAVRILLSGTDLLLIQSLPCPSRGTREGNRTWNPGFQMDALLEIRNLLRRYRATWINFLSDPACVHILSDKLAIFSQSMMVQDGSLKECMTAPASRMVADFLSFPVMNYKRARVEQDGPFIMLRCGRYGFRVSEYIKRSVASREGQELVLGIQPDSLGIRTYETGDPTVLNLARITSVDNVPGGLIVRLDADGSDWVAHTEPGRALFTGQLVELRPDPDMIMLFHPHNGANLLD